MGIQLTGYGVWNVGSRVNWAIDSSNNLHLDGEFYSQTTGSLNTSSRFIISINDFYKTNIVLNHDGKYGFGDIENYFQFSQTMRYPQKNVPVGGNKGNSLDRNSLRNDKVFVLSSIVNNKKTSFDFNDYGIMFLNGELYYMYENLLTRSNQAFHGDQHQVAIFGEGKHIIMNI